MGGPLRPFGGYDVWTTLISTSAPVFKVRAGSRLPCGAEKRVEEYFVRTGRSHHGGIRLGLKAIIITGLAHRLVLSLVFGAETWWQTALLALSLSFAMALSAFNIQHDGNARIFLRYRWVNRMTGTGLDLLAEARTCGPFSTTCSTTATPTSRGGSRH